MKKERKLAAFRSCLRRYLAVFVIFAVCAAVSSGIFLLYGVDTEPLVYSLVLGAFIMAVFFAVSCAREIRRAGMRERVIQTLPHEWEFAWQAETAMERDYREMIEIMGRRLRELVSDTDREKQEMSDYYTAWVHQIKTPIAVMRMMLSEDTEENRRLLLELFRIEQYAEMALQYIRLDADASDLVVREYPLDEIIREAVRKSAPQFIMKNIGLVYEGTDKKITTDRKWLGCILEQLLSNAVKYTTEGSVMVAVTGDSVTVSDTGIGIPAEDIPRIFEKGFTGVNGRTEKRSSGLGLYLCRKAADRLNISIEVTSTAGAGSCFKVHCIRS